MKLVPHYNRELGEAEYYTNIERQGYNTRSVKVNPNIEAGLYHIEEEIKIGNDTVYKQSYTIDRKLVEALQGLI